MNWTWIFAIAALAGPILIAASPKKQAGDKDQPVGVQTGYLLLVLGVFGVLAQVMSFTAVMLVFVLVTGLATAFNRFVLAPKRAAGATESSFIEYSRGFFPIILVVFLLRSFLAEPFQIPSSSMRPGLVVGDFILVNKFAYGIRTPVINNVAIPVGQVQRGDVVVFNFPPNPQVNFIKRAIGLPGDTIEYRNKQLTVNGKPVPDVESGSYDYIEQGLTMVRTGRYSEKMGSRHYDVIKVDGAPTVYVPAVTNFDGREACRYDDSGFVCKVPQGQYFMMGDNRDNSHDSRYWGFVPDKLIVGKAFMIWLNFGDFGRIGNTIH